MNNYLTEQLLFNTTTPKTPINTRTNSSKHATNYFYLNSRSQSLVTNTLSYFLMHVKDLFSLTMKILLKHSPIHGIQLIMLQIGQMTKMYLNTILTKRTLFKKFCLKVFIKSQLKKLRKKGGKKHAILFQKI